ncbi:MAG: methyltransferase domain-containing protein [Actinomycetota bacterium]|nr:methyltransferase domain-containing protein [Actinomycetota bacterium]
MARAQTPTAGVAARRLAIQALTRVSDEGAYANLVLPALLERSTLESRDRGLVTELVYGTTRMQRACDFLVDRFVLDEVQPTVRSALRVGAYQLHFMRTPPHAAVAATVGAVAGRGRSVVNAVLRRVANSDVVWPDDATRLSYPDWIVSALGEALGRPAALAALETMNRPADVHTRDDGYVQDPASQLVVDAVDAREGDLVLDLCAAPGGKATGLASLGARVVAADLRPNRARLIARNATSTGTRVPVVIADGTSAPFAPRTFDRILIDAPCSGLGSLRRRPDARWRIDAAAPRRLADLQVALVQSAYELLAPGGVLVYSVCTLTDAETIGVLDRVRSTTTLELLDPPGSPWTPIGSVGCAASVARLLPGGAEPEACLPDDPVERESSHDGMALWRARKPR